MIKLNGVSVFFVLGVATAGCGSAGNAFSGASDSGGATANGGASGGSGGTTNGTAGTMNGSAGTTNGSAGTMNGSAGTMNGSAGTDTAGGASAGGLGGSGAGGATSGSGGGNVGGASGGSAGTGGGPACPSPAGYYTIIVSAGAGCGDFDRNVPVCAESASQVCQFTLKGSSDKSLDGSVLLKANATFEGAMITEGSTTRTGCTGNFATDTGILSVTCGGSNPSSNQYCGLKLTRTADTCP